VPDTVNLEIPYKAQTKQELLHSVPANEILYGGSAGGGKSHALRWEGYLLCQQIPNLHVYLFRRTFPELERTHIIASQHEFPTHIEHAGERIEIANYQVGQHRWKFANGSMLHYCHAEKNEDVYRYKSEEIHVLMMDELTSFLEDQYRFLRSRVRMPEDMRELLPEELKARIPGVIAASNPGDRGHAWVKRYWIDTCNPTTSKTDIHLVKMPKSEGGRTRAFIPATLDDNKYLDTEEYEGMLLGLGGVLARAMRYGDWEIFAGQAFPELNKEIHGIEPFDWSGYTRQYMAMDWGYAKPFSIGWYCMDFDGVLYRIYEWYGCADPNKPGEGLRMNVAEVAGRIKQIEKDLELKPRQRVASPDLWVDRGMGSRKDMHGPTLAEEFSRCGLHFERADNRRLMGKQQMHLRLKYVQDERGEVVESPSFRVITKNCPYFWRMLPLMVLDEKKGFEDVDEKQEDHLYEEVRYMMMARPVHTPFPHKRAPRMSLKHIDEVDRKAKKKARRYGTTYEDAYRAHF